MDLDIATAAEQPGREALWAQLDNGWPPFMMNDPTGDLYYRHVASAYPEYALLAVDRQTGRAVAKALSVPLAYDGDIADGLPQNPQ